MVLKPMVLFTEAVSAVDLASKFTLNVTADQRVRKHEKAVGSEQSLAADVCGVVRNQCAEHEIS